MDRTFGGLGQAGQYGEEKLAKVSASNLTRLEQMKMYRRQLAEKLQAYDDAIAALEANPDFADLLHKLEKAAY